MGPQEFELRSVATLTDDTDGEPRRPWQSSSLAKDKQVIRYYKRSLWIFGFYLLILVLPWIFTCVLMVRPINKESYFNQAGSITPGDVNNWNRSRVALSCLTALSSVIGLPIVSGLLAHGAVVYTQRRNPGQRLNVLQLFALADREWLDPRYLFKSPVKVKSTEKSLYLWLATFLILITAVQPPIQAILVRDERIDVVTCKGHPAAHNNYNSRACRFPYKDLNTQIIARDAEPIDLNFCPQDVVVKKTSQKLLSSANNDIQINLWSDEASLGKDPNYYTDNRRTLDWYYQESSYVKSKRLYYASSVANGTSTGVYRHHAARMDSKANCYLSKVLPKECKGSKPFVSSFSEGWLNVDICAEGSYDTVAWNTSRSKQEHNETLWLSMKWDIPEGEDSSGLSLNNDSYVLRCDSVSRRGWFQLPNNANGGKPGSLRDEWPSWRELKYEFNDYYIDSPQRDLKFPEDRYPAAEYDSEPAAMCPFPFLANHLSPTRIPDEELQKYRDQPRYTFQGPPVPGPLMTVALAMFGNSSFFQAARVADRYTYNQTIDNICENSLFPMLGMMPRDYDYDLGWCSPAYFNGLKNEEATALALEKAMFFANEALLTTAASLPQKRPIFYSPGTAVMKPKKDLAAMITVTALIGLQVMALCALMWFILRAPTWTETLDADALTQIGGQLKEWGETRPDLTQINGIVGVDEPRHQTEPLSMRLSSGQDAASQPGPLHITLGGEGLINRGLIKKMQADTTTVVQA
ncbi:hypothetical protein FGADI_3693 [Fusarium gaditjirri]|uniref:Uncharacterized protein n=1 Tax=Fusarium gaditjirri TaxID=282569 RepID=A0A8H4X0N1_9HYPO|nr:hypothetical protein FGADI_3693 [Fusarium gaditjirri]